MNGYFDGAHPSPHPARSSGPNALATRLLRPYPQRAGGRLWILVILIVTCLVLVGFGLDPAAAVAIATAVGLAATEVASRLLGPAPRSAG